MSIDETRIFDETLGKYRKLRTTRFATSIGPSRNSVEPIPNLKPSEKLTQLFTVHVFQNQ
jgi:hypothetical protein